MAVVLNITYSKKLGLPHYSSHSCSVSVQVEVSDLSQVAQENARLYQLLQSSVDEEIKQVGYLPDGPKQNGNGNGSNAHHRNGNGNGSDSGISEKQIDLINRIVKDNNLSKTSVDELPWKCSAAVFARSIVCRHQT